MRLLVTRPAPDNLRTARVLAAQGHVVLLAPVLRIETLDWTLSDQPYGGIIITSANAARVIAGKCECAELTSLPVFTTGRHTARAAQAAGFRDVHCAEGDRGDLARLVREQFDVRRGPLLHLAGEDRAGDIDLPQIAVTTAPIYRMIKAERFSPAIEEALVQRQIDGVLHFSRRSAQAYVECARRAGLLVQALVPVHFCLSGQVAEPLATTQCIGIKIAARPEEGALIELVNRT